MNKVLNISRKRDVAAALGSVRAEGLNPSAKTQKRLNDYANGKISAAEIRKLTLHEVRTASK